jgi:hypothetical protein
MYEYTITFQSDVKHNPGDITHLCAILSNKSNRSHRECEINVRELGDNNEPVWAWVT